MNKLSKEKRDRVLLVAIGTCAILAAFYLLIVTGQRTALADYATQIDAEQQKLDKAERWLRMAPTIETRLNTIHKDLEAKQEDMAPVDKFKWFYNTLESALARHKVQLVDITREPELGEVGVLPKFPYRTATFGVKLLASFHDYGTFLAEFENRFPYMRVQNLQIEPKVEADAESSQAVPLARRPPGSGETLDITMRVVTLVRPGGSL
ncbi:MAG: hypothetical protein AB9869_10940 [Verrucomicrobiia bacterium]